MATADTLAAALVVDSAEQDVPSFRKKVALGKDTMLSGAGLHHIAHYTAGVLDFALDVLAHPAISPGTDADELAAARSVFRRVGAQIVYRVGELDRRIQELRSGVLIRVVGQSDRGVVVCNWVVRNEHIVGFAPIDRAWNGAMIADPGLASKPDKAMSELSNGMRALVRQRPLNPGGWLTANVPPDGSALAESVDPVVVGRFELTDLLVRAVDVSTLHYLAYYRDDVALCEVDVLAHPELAGYFSREHSPVDRRAHYQRWGADMSLLAMQFGRDVHATIGGAIDRLVLDVEMGALFYYRLHDDEYLFGVTMDQDMVSQSDDRLAELAGKCFGTLE